MVEYSRGRLCLMQSLAQPLGDAAIPPCRRCFVCTGQHIGRSPDLDALTEQAEEFHLPDPKRAGAKVGRCDVAEVL